MDDKIDNLRSYCSEVDFGVVNLLDSEKEFYKELNNEIMLLCKSLPESTQDDALIFSLRYSGLSFGDELNFFKNYYAPTWSIIYWLIQACPIDKKLTKKEIKNSITGHTMAMSLHSLDDHLNDGEVPSTHLTLLLRSQSWMIMKNAFDYLAAGVDGGGKIVQDFIDDYYDSIRCPKEIKLLDSYCDLFRKQMATGMIVPVLLARMMSNSDKFSNAIQVAYGSFGIAWRLLDDIKDIELDMANSIHSSIYVCLPERAKNIWDQYKDKESNKKDDFTKIIIECLVDNGIIKRIKDRICSELKIAASIADDLNLTGLADEFRCLLTPFRIDRTDF